MQLLMESDKYFCWKMRTNIHNVVHIFLGIINMWPLLLLIAFILASSIYCYYSNPKAREFGIANPWTPHSVCSQYRFVMKFIFQCIWVFLLINQIWLWCDHMILSDFKCDCYIELCTSNSLSALKINLSAWITCIFRAPAMKLWKKCHILTLMTLTWPWT